MRAAAFHKTRSIGVAHLFVCVYVLLLLPLAKLKLFWHSSCQVDRNQH